MSGGRRALRRGVVAGPRLSGLLTAAALVASLGTAATAEAYVRYKTKAGLGFFWPQTCIPVSVYPASMMDLNGNMEMTAAEIVHASSAAAAAWGGGQNVCSFLQINVTESSDPTPQAGLDYLNVLVFREKSWCAPSDVGTCSYAAEALAITSVFVDKRSGRIVDGDIEVNAKNFVWTDLDVDPAGKGKQDLQNALTHEMGHLIGLDHSCFSPGTPGGPPLDNSGKAVPSCDNAPAAVQATTMFASAIPGDTAKRTLAQDDIQAVCDVYPRGKDPMECPLKDEPPPKTGCAFAPPGPRGGAAALAALAAVALAARRRRRERRT